MTESAKPQLLVIDDESNCLEYLEAVLSDRYDLSIFTDPSDGLESCQTNKYDAVLLDYRMPSMNGIEFAKEFRKQDPKTPIILMTGFGNKDLAAGALKARITDFIEKPLDDDLIGLIQEHLDVRQAEVERDQALLEAKTQEAHLKYAKEQNARLTSAMIELSNTKAKLLQSEKLAGLGTLAKGIAHELNNPLTIMQGCSQILLKKCQDDPEKIKLVEKILSSGARMKNIINHMRASVSEKPEKFELVNLREIAQSTIGIFEAKLQEEGITIAIKGEPSPTILGRKNSIATLFKNFLTNSLDAYEDQTENDERIISITFSIGDGVKFIYKDNASGIDPQHLENVFDPFFTTKDTGKGNGLGLFTCYKIIRDHNGQVQVDSKLSKGTSFMIRFPLVKSDPEPFQDQFKIDIKGHSKSSLRLIMVETEIYTLEFAAEVLREEFKVSGYQNPNQALDVIKEDPEHISIILTALNFPQINAAEWIQSLKLTAPNTPIVVMTGLGMADPRINEIKGMGIAAIISKPFEDIFTLSKDLHQYIADTKKAS